MALALGAATAAAAAVAVVVRRRRNQSALPWLQGTHAECWFCGAASPALAPTQVNRWTCTACGGYNGFDEDGNYNKVLRGLEPRTDDDDSGGGGDNDGADANAYGPAPRYVVSAEPAPGGVASGSPTPLCRACTRGQQEWLRQRDAFFNGNRRRRDGGSGSGSDSDDEASSSSIDLNDYALEMDMDATAAARARSEDAFPLCVACTQAVHARLQHVQRSVKQVYLGASLGRSRAVEVRATRRRAGQGIVVAVVLRLCTLLLAMQTTAMLCLSLRPRFCPTCDPGWACTDIPGLVDGTLAPRLDAVLGAIAATVLDQFVLHWALLAALDMLVLVWQVAVVGDMFTTSALNQLSAAPLALAGGGAAVLAVQDAARLLAPGTTYTVLYLLVVGHVAVDVLLLLRGMLVCVLGAPAAAATMAAAQRAGSSATSRFLASLKQLPKASPRRHDQQQQQHAAKDDGDDDDEEDGDEREGGKEQAGLDPAVAPDAGMSPRQQRAWQRRREHLAQQQQQHGGARRRAPSVASRSTRMTRFSRMSAGRDVPGFDESSDEEMQPPHQQYQQHQQYKPLQYQEGPTDHEAERDNEHPDHVRGEDGDPQPQGGGDDDDDVAMLPGQARLVAAAAVLAVGVAPAGLVLCTAELRFHFGALCVAMFTALGVEYRELRRRAQALHQLMHAPLLDGSRPGSPHTGSPHGSNRPMPMRVVSPNRSLFRDAVDRELLQSDHHSLLAGTRPHQRGAHGLVLAALDWVLDRVPRPRAVYSACGVYVLLSAGHAMSSTTMLLLWPLLRGHPTLLFGAPLAAMLVVLRCLRRDDTASAEQHLHSQQANALHRTASTTRSPANPIPMQPNLNPHHLNGSQMMLNPPHPVVGGPDVLRRRHHTNGMQPHL